MKTRMRGWLAVLGAVLALGFGAVQSQADPTVTSNPGNGWFHETYGSVTSSWTNYDSLEMWQKLEIIYDVGGDHRGSHHLERRRHISWTGGRDYEQDYSSVAVTGHEYADCGDTAVCENNIYGPNVTSGGICQMASDTPLWHFHCTTFDIQVWESLDHQIEESITCQDIGANDWSIAIGPCWTDCYHRTAWQDETSPYLTYGTWTSENTGLSANASSEAAWAYQIGIYDGANLIDGDSMLISSPS